MSIEKDKSGTLEFPSQTPTVEIKPHPKEILDLDEETIAIARAKLAGVDFDEIYGEEDKVSPAFLIKVQADKIRELFRTPEELKLAFSSPLKIEEALKDMMIDGIDLNFVKSYCSKRQIQFLDDAQALIAVGFASDKSGAVNV